LNVAKEVRGLIQSQNEDDERMVRCTQFTENFSKIITETDAAHNQVKPHTCGKRVRRIAQAARQAESQRSPRLALAPSLKEQHSRLNNIETARANEQKA